MHRMAPFLLVGLVGCGPDLTITTKSEADVEPSLRRFLDGYQVVVRSARRSGNDVQVHFQEEAAAATLVSIRKGLDRLIGAEPTKAPLVLRLTGEEADEAEEVRLISDPASGGMGLYSVDRGFGTTATLCVWEMSASNLPPMGQGFAVRDDVPAELRDSLTGLVDSLNAVGMVRDHEFRLGEEAFDSGAESVQFEPGRILFVFEEESSMTPPSMIGLPPAKFAACMRTVMRRASDAFVAEIMFPTLSAEVASYSTE